MRFTQQNLDAGFSLAHELAKAKDMTEMLQIQNRHAQLQMHAYVLQAQELGTLLNIALQKAKPGGRSPPDRRRVPQAAAPAGSKGLLVAFYDLRQIGQRMIPAKRSASRDRKKEGASICYDPG